MLHARTLTEIFLYLDVHPCVCGQTQVDWTQELLNSEAGRVVRLSGQCPSCGADRHYEFLLEQPNDGSRNPSTLLDAGEFLWLSDQAAERVPVATVDLAPARLESARADLIQAVDLLNEVIAFIPEGESAVPASSVTSALGEALLRAEPARFTRAELVERIGLYQRKIDQLVELMSSVDRQHS